MREVERLLHKAMRTLAYVRDSEEEARVLLVRARVQLDAVIADMPPPFTHPPVDVLTTPKDPRAML